MSQLLLNALRETLIMVATAGSIAFLISVPLGIFIASISNSPYKSIKILYQFLFNMIKLIRGIPFLLLIVLFIPVTNWLIAKKLSYMTATIAPLATAGVLMLTVKVNDITYDILQKWSATCKQLGATTKQSIFMVVLPEALPKFFTETANTVSALVSFSIIAGALGAGGLGQLAIEKSITDPNLPLVLGSILLVVAIQQLIKYTGSLVVQQT